MYDGLELGLREEVVQHLRAGGLGVGHAAWDAGPEDAVLRRRHPKRLRNRLGRPYREGGAAHDSGVKLHGNHHQAIVGSGEVGIEGEALHDRGAVDEADVVVLGGVVQGELEPLLAQEQLVLVHQLDGGGDH